MNGILLSILCVFLSVWLLLWLSVLVLCVRKMKQDGLSPNIMVQHLFYIFITAGIAFPFVLTYKNKHKNE